MLVNIYASTQFKNPALYVWRPGTNLAQHCPPSKGPDAHAFWTFKCELDHQIHEDVLFKLYDRPPEHDTPTTWEQDVHNRGLPRVKNDKFAEHVWIIEGAHRVLEKDPFAQAFDEVRIHLISQRKYRNGRMFVWRSAQDAEQPEVLEGTEEEGGMRFVIKPGGDRRHLFQFKFIQPEGTFEADIANRVWSSEDGAEIWVHSDAAGVSVRMPKRRELRVHLQQGQGATPPTMHLWQFNSDFVTDCVGVWDANGWSTHKAELYTGLEYKLKFHNPDEPSYRQWEHSEAERSIILADGKGPVDCWTLEGDKHIFDHPPQPNKKVAINVAAVPPNSTLQAPYHAHVWINRARWPLQPHLSATDSNGTSITLHTFPDVVTSFLLGSGEILEPIERHTLVVPSHTTGPFERYAVVTRPDVLLVPPPSALFQDPPFLIQRPGVYEAAGQLRFVLHAPTAARAQVIGQWTGWRNNPMEMRSTVDGTYWWAQAPVSDITQTLGVSSDYHGALYKYLLSEVREVQDPAAGWVESSSPDKASRLVRSDNFTWQDEGIDLSHWDRWIVYQLHPSRFSKRFDSKEPLLQVAKELEDPNGYLRKLKANALLLMPVNEVGTTNSWGYDPAFYYAVEEAYGGPDALKTLVNTCHRNGIAVMLDVVFNHAGTVDNSLWATARTTFFDGDTTWGAMLNFDQPQCRHFFEQNLVYLQKEYHIDGFRLDHTYTIVHSSEQQYYVRQPGSGGGWEFLHALRYALETQGNRKCLLMAEHLPNEWTLTNYGGPMDTQWDDAFHDRLEDACRGWDAMSTLADALKHSYTVCDNWYKPTNYPESHDEVGNDPDRIAFIAGYGRGLRMSKVAGACTLLTRGIPMFFMGAESGEYRQFRFNDSSALDLDEYLSREDLSHVREWWNVLSDLHNSDNIKGPSPLDVRYAQNQKLAFSRGQAGDLFVLLNFGGWAGRINLDELNIPDHTYHELWNSTWPAFSVEQENEHTNGGREARLHRGDWLNVPDYGAIVLERV
jgi:1,4-alpha-glucan branching enzyme